MAIFQVKLNCLIVLSSSAVTGGNFWCDLIPIPYHKQKNNPTNKQTPNCGETKGMLFPVRQLSNVNQTNTTAKHFTAIILVGVLASTSVKN